MNTIIDTLNLTNYIVVGVSSGPDSMCLLSLLEEKKAKIVVCHINHNIRKESKDEEAFLKEYCKKHNFIFEAMTIDKYEENNFENEARKKRYKFYEKTLRKYHSNYLFLAHHGDDLIETILMKIARGSNIEGYAGIKEISDFKEFKIVRPLLSYTKDDIINYNKSHNIPYFIDNSNTNVKYTRNRYRKNILPLLKAEDKNIHLKFLRYSKTLEEYDNYIKKIVKSNIKNVFHDKTIYIDELNKLDPFIQQNTLYYILNIIYNNQSNIITERHVNNIIDLIHNNKPNMEMNLPMQKTLIKEYNKIHISQNINKPKSYKIEYKNNITINNLIFTEIKKEASDGNDICRLNSKAIKLPLYFRSRKEGDYIILKGSNSKKKIKEIFIENKIPINKRDNHPLLIDDNDNILWIPNIKKSNFCIKKDEKEQNYDIIIKCDEREENYE